MYTNNILKQKYLKYKEKYLIFKGGYPFTKEQKEKIKIHGLEIDEDTDISNEILDEIIAEKIKHNKQHVVYSKSKCRGKIHEQNKTFYIYTTGIIDAEQLIKVWVDTLYENIKSSIPIEFKIIVNHYDPTPYKNQEKEKLIKELEKYNNQIFYNEELPYKNLERPHIVIDFAHIFGYYPNDENKYDAYWSGYYDYLIPDKVTKDIITKSNIKSIYLGFYCSEIAKCKLINVDSYGNIITFIDRLIDLELINNEETDIKQIIDDQIYKLKNSMLGKWKDKGHTLTTFDEQFIYYNLLCEFLEKLFKYNDVFEIFNIENYEFNKEIIKLT
jgi:hypothetical protein